MRKSSTFCLVRNNSLCNTSKTAKKTFIPVQKSSLHYSLPGNYIEANRITLGLSTV